MKTTIRNKILISFTALLSIVFFSQIVFNIFFAEDYYLSHKSKVIEDGYHDLVSAFDGTEQSIEDIALYMENAHNIDILIVYNQGVFYNSSHRSLDRINPNFNNDVPFPRLPDDFIERFTFDNNPSTQYKPSKMVPNDILELSNAFKYNGEDVYIMLSLPIASISEATDILSSSSIYISLSALLISIILCLFVSNSISKPINSIQQVAYKLANLDFSNNLNENISTKELSSLSHSINSMSSQLETTINELNKANEKLQEDIDYQKQIDEMRKEFVGNVSHEMKTPLALLQMYAENLKNNADKIDKDYYCDTIIEETENLSNMVSSMLDISSIESGLSQMHMNNMSLSDLTVSLIAKVSPLTEGYNLSTMVQPDISVIGDVKYLEQAMKNFITNAVDHTTAGNKISISLEKQDSLAVFTVYNEGSSIAQSDTHKLWQSFYRVDKARTRSGNNVGLGLHIVRTIIEKHGGSYSCRNINDGVEFTFTLPSI